MPQKRHGVTCLIELCVLHWQALGIALKLTIEGDNQFVHPQVYFCLLVSGCACNPHLYIAEWLLQSRLVSS